MTATPETLLRAAEPRLRAACEHPRREAERLLAAVLAVPTARLVAGLVGTVAAAPAAQFEHWLARRAAGEPFAYLTGEQAFRGLSLRVTPDVLIPRGETEQLVDWALDVLAPCRAPQVWDVCTGSGCIALAIAQECPPAVVRASDVSAAALGVARGNAARLGLQRVAFFESDLLSPGHFCESANGVGFHGEHAHLIISNPPYIAERDPHLPALAHEPRLALVAGDDGLALLRPLIAQAPSQLAPGGWLLLEHGWDQGAAVRALLQAEGFAEVQTRRDYAGHERMSGGKIA